MLFYVVSKTLWFLGQPSSLFWLLSVSGLGLISFSRQQRLGRRLAWLGIVLLFVGGLSPLSSWLLLPLEQRFAVPAVADGSREFAGIIVLGGAEDGRVSEARGQLHANEAGERIMEAAVLARRLPSARLVFSGGAARVFLDDLPGAPSVGRFWQQMGIAAERIVLEDRSLTTAENAAESRTLLQPRPGQKWLLVTSAQHMPRSVGVFRAAGFEVVAYPVDYRTTGADDLRRPFWQLGSGLKRLDDTVREWVGLVAYCLLGRSASCFPGP